MPLEALQSRTPDGDFRFCLVLPRAALSIPVMRHVLDDTLNRLGVDEESVNDLLLAATEACTNVVQHAGPGRRYEVVVEVARDHCVLDVLDDGRGFGSARMPVRRVLRRRPPMRPSGLIGKRANSDQLAESGRGLSIMQACVDDVTLRTGHGRGTVVSMHKRIGLRGDSPVTSQPASVLRNAG